MVNKADKNKARLNRHRRVRGKISGTAECPRLNVFRSTNNIYAQIIDDVKGVTLVAASTLDKDFNGNGGNKEAARSVPLKKGSKRSYLTAAATFSMAASKSWPMAPARVASSSK